MRDDHLRHLTDDETGSMVIAMLAMIVAAGLMVVVAGYAFSGHRAVRFDRDRNVVIQTADAGINEVLYRLQAGQSVPQGALQPAESLGSSGSFRWRVDPHPNASGADLKVTSEGTYNGRTRTVQAILVKPKPFNYGVFADSRMTLNGGNSVNSYNATTWNTGVGEIGSNGNVRLNGGNVTADGVDLYGWDTNSTAERCVENGNTVCSTKSETFPAPRDLTSADALAFIADGLNACTSTLPAAPWPATMTLNAGVYCGDRIEIPKDAVININSTPANPVIIYLTGPADTSLATVAVGNKARVNCPTISGSPALCSPRPEASKLQIYTASAMDVRIGAHSHFAGTVYAPRASCRGNLSNAQAHIYGALVCRTVTNQGGWNFHYDQRLADVGVGHHRVRNWSE